MKLDVYICACAILVSARNGAPSARLRPASCLRRQPIARMHGQHPSGHGPDFVSTAGSRGPGIAEPAPAPPACQGRDARALKKNAHRPPPACASTSNLLRSHVLISAVYARARVPNAITRTGLTNSISNQYCARACACSRACQCC